MEQLKYVIEDKTIASILGKENFTTDESAILEIVKNAYDAQAKEIEIIFNDGEIIIKDDGIGMDDKDIKNKWMHVGNSNKDYKTEDNKRVLSGSKGIGRFALAKLGKEIEMYTCKNGEEYLWRTNWDKSEFTVASKHLIDKGTCFYIKKSFTNWTSDRIYKLIEYLSRSYKDDSMEIHIKFKENEVTVGPYYTKSSPGKNCQASINLLYDKTKTELLVEIKSDEFKEEAAKYCKELNLKKHSIVLNMYDELSSGGKLVVDDLKTVLCDLGSFNCELAYRIRPGKQECEKFLYKHQEFDSEQKHGIALYRNAFSINSYEGYRDWLSLASRYRKSPAAASHDTGAWRIRENQLSGYICIDKKENKNLIDLSNRQGLVENEYYDVFINIIKKGIEEFERYRQKIIRAIDVKNKRKVVIKKDTISKIKNSKTKELLLTNEMKKKLLDEINAIEKNQEKIRSEKIENERKYIYDVKILNSLATNGLKASSIAHELKNDKNNLSNNIDFIIEELKRQQLWEVINSPNNTEVTYQNIPLLLESNKKINKKTISFIDTLLSGIEKKQFIKSIVNINQLIENIKNEWEWQYSWIKVKTKIAPNVEYNIAESDLRVIFDNLILNSIQQNEKNDRLEIMIECKNATNPLDFMYKDNGIGLNIKYKNNPERILEVHETTRKNGHGLGMWIVNNTIKSLEGHITSIKSDNGFKIEFTLGEINDER